MGEITVLDNHETLITVLVAGVIKIIPAKSRDGEAVLRDRGALFFPIKSGFLQVKENNEARCIVEE